MARLNDIPEHLLKDDQLIPFTTWLSKQQMHITDKRELTRMWSRFTGKKLTDAQWLLVK